MVFAARGAEHHLEVWRDGDLRVKRRTDDAVEAYAVHAPGEAEYQLSILDLRRRLHTRIARVDLYRLGSFTDWFDLTHGLRHPRAGYHLARAGAPAGAPRAVEACDWYALAEGQRTVHVCWSAHDRLPLLVLDAGGAVAWRVTAVDRGPIAADTFVVHDEGFVRNDASADIEGD